MQISDVKVPDDAKIEIRPLVLTERPELAMFVALIIASWSETEARLDSIFLTLVKDEAKLAEFKKITGWDHRVKFMSAAVKEAVGDRAAAKVRAIMGVISTASKKRNEVAHGIWIACQGMPSKLALCTAAAFTHATRTALKAEAAGSAQMNLQQDDFFSDARIVEESHLRKAWEECEESRSLLSTFWIEELPDIVKVNQDIPAAKTIEHVEVAVRLHNAERDIRRNEKAKAKKQRSSQLPEENMER